ncbi:glycosyltransferase [Anaeromyxobacter oryzisoli]|uniref:glycosyltransferase n=1 Tax=Anaeromyxobacter oryzisoli TaxID=2925408 RepID=UPI001F581546|nr:glycosyltransferase [Anaeromyxobacter sp. SG63]
MRTSVVLLTYERPDALALALRGLARQRLAPDEVIVTDDGSSPSTRACAVHEARDFPCPVVFLTQEKRGARMSRARNRGIAAARGDYVIFLDGDQVPARDFVADHVAFARPGSFVQGSRILASAETTARLLAVGGLDVSPFEPGLERRRHALRAPALWWLFGWRRRSRRGLKSCNFAFWRDDLVRMNGFDEDMIGWGLEDGELAERGYHLGLWRRDLRLGGGVIHLWHGPPSVLSADNPNRRIYDATLASGRVRCEHGLDAHLAELAGPLPDLREEAARAASPR